MKVAILQCDSVMEKLEPEFGSYSDMIRHMFDDIDESLEFEVFDCQQTCYPDDINDYEFYITTGSKASAFEEQDWIRQLIEFIQLLDAEKKKLIGICFGHQVIALALGGDVTRSDKGWGIGLASNRMVARPDWMTHSPSTLNIFVSHQDQVTLLPAGARVIAESDFCPFFMLQWNEHFLSIQGHPEWNREYCKALLKERRKNIETDRFAAAMLSLQSQADNRLFSQWILNFVRQ